METNTVITEIDRLRKVSPISVDIVVLSGGEYRKIKSISQFSGISDIVLEME